MLGLCLPGAQAVHTLLAAPPRVGEYLPEGQLTQELLEVAPENSLYLPAGQLVHDPLAAPVLNVPGGQLRQDAGALAKVPAGQVLGA